MSSLAVLSSLPDDLVDASTFFDVSLDMLCIRDLQGRVVKVGMYNSLEHAQRPLASVFGYPAVINKRRNKKLITEGF